MSSTRHPVAVWGDARGWTAALLDDLDFVTFAPEKGDALQDLREHLVAQARARGFVIEPDAEDVRVVSVKVKLTAEYRTQNKVFPVEGAPELLFPCVLANSPSGLTQCSVPSLGLQFYYEEGRSLKELVNHYVRERLAGSTPYDLARHRPPERMEIEFVSVRGPSARVGRPDPETPSLGAVADPMARMSGRCYGREALGRELEQRLEHKASVLLVGPPGCGKTALLAEVARRLEKTRDKEKHPAPRLWHTSAARLIAGMKYLGQWEERLQEVISELASVGAILAVENLLEMVRQGGEPNASLAAFLAPYLEGGEVQLVAEVTPAELVACTQALPQLVDLFQVLRVPSLQGADAESVAGRMLELHGQRRRCNVYARAAADIVGLFARFEPYSAFPGNVSRFLRGLPAHPQLDRAEVFAAFSQHTGVPERFLRDEVLLDAEELEWELQEQVIGQPAASAAGTRLLTTFKAGLQDPERPLGSLLLCGPTGVGKTELARTLARTVFGNEKRLIRLDMSEFSGGGAAERLLGSVYDAQPSELVRKLRRQPFSVVLLDEVEKAHPEVFDVLLRALDEGLWTDPWGRETSFRSAIILLTSNLGAELIKDVGLRRHEAPSYEGAARAFFRPEFLNRLDGIISFAPLSRDEVRKIAAKEVRALERRAGLRRRGLRLEVGGRLVDELVAQGYDPRLGARPLQRVVERLVVRGLGRYLAAHPSLRDVTLAADWDGVQLSLGVAR